MTGKRKKRLIIAAVFLAALLALWLFLQHVLPHIWPPFRPDYPQADLSPILAQETLDREDYETLFAQTGLGPAAINDLLAQGPAGVEQIQETQRGFFAPPGEDTCSLLGITTREHRRRDDSGRMVPAVPLAPLKEGDILVSFSTHTAGWTHGHAGLVVDAQSGVSLESVVLGSVSTRQNVAHWPCYTTFMVLRPKADDEARAQVVRLAQEKLTGIPYSLVCGIFGDKLQPLDGPHSAHCSYLPWYAWLAAAGLDLDGDGGRIVTPRDLAESPLVEVVQLYGIDPGQFPLDLPD